MPFDWFKKKTADGPPPSGPDYSSIDSPDKAQELYQKKVLDKMYLMPLEFGGEDSELNTLYVPPHVKMFKARLDAMIEKLLMDGKKIGYSVNPEYKGASCVPCRVVIKVTGEAQITETIEAW